MARCWGGPSSVTPLSRRATFSRKREKGYNVEQGYQTLLPFSREREKGYGKVGG